MNSGINLRRPCIGFTGDDLGSSVCPISCARHNVYAPECRLPADFDQMPPPACLNLFPSPAPPATPPVLINAYPQPPPPAPPAPPMTPLPPVPEGVVAVQTLEQLQQLVDRTIIKADKDRDGKISFEEFQDMVQDLDVIEKLTINC